MNTPTPPAGYKLIKGEDIKDRVPEGALIWSSSQCLEDEPEWAPSGRIGGQLYGLEVKSLYAIPETKPEPVKANDSKVHQKLHIEAIEFYNPLSQQEGGDHYKSLAIQPVEFIQANKLSFLEGCVVKRVCRHRAKNKAEDIRKAIHELRLILKLEYGEG
jgi:hypothetical protein